METYFIPYRNSSIHYYRFGQGPRWLFCFHGYGEDGASFELLKPLLGDAYTVIAIDSPFHGRTDWQDGLLFDTSDLIAILNLIRPPAEPISLLGYSMGGRVALQLIESMTHEVKKVVLVAPDGLHKNKWQWLSTRTSIGKRLFAYTMRTPYLMFGLMGLAGKLGLYNKSLLKFVHYYLDDAEQRSLLYHRWTTMRKFRPHLGLLKQIIIKNKIPVRMLFGRFDRVILAKYAFHFSKEAESYIQVTEIEAGHQLLREKYAPLIAELLM